MDLARCLPEENILPTKPPNLLFLQSISGDYLKPTEVGVPLMFILAGLFSFFFFFNNQGSRKCGELTAWQQQRNSLGKLRCSSLRFQPLRQASQRNNRLLVVFNLFFCGTFLVQETNLSVQRGGAWELNCQVVVLIRGLLQQHQTGLSNLSLTSTDRDMSLLLFKTLPTKNLFYKCNIVHKILLCKEKWQGAKFVNFA